MRQISVAIYDDLDAPAQTPAIITDLAFFYQGHWYQIDLGEHNLKLYTELMETMLLRGRACDEMPAKPGGTMLEVEGLEPPELPKHKLNNAQKTARAKQQRPIREWARANGWPNLSNMGLIPLEIRQAYADAHPGEVT